MREKESEGDGSCRRWESEEGRFNKVECQEKKTTLGLFGELTEPATLACRDADVRV